MFKFDSRLGTLKFLIAACLVVVMFVVSSNGKTFIDFFVGKHSLYRKGGRICSGLTLVDIKILKSYKVLI